MTTTTCQICAREVKANTGLIAHHGYRRPGQGWQTSSCMGARYRPYEVACDAIQRAIEAIETFLELRRPHLANVIANPPAHMIYQRRDAWGKPSGSGHALFRPEGFDATNRPGSYRSQSYESVYWPMRREIEQSIKAAEGDLEFLTKRLAAWVAPSN